MIALIVNRLQQHFAIAISKSEIGSLGSISITLGPGFPLRILDFIVGMFSELLAAALRDRLLRKK